MEGSKSPGPEHDLTHKRSTADLQEDDDSATMKASEDLKHTKISDNEPIQLGEADKAEGVSEEAEDASPAGSTTPENTLSNAEDEDMKDRIASPKKKRTREHDDDAKEGEDTYAAAKDRVPSGGSAAGGADRTDRLEPEKKRPRDALEEEAEKTAGLNKGTPNAQDAQDATIESDGDKKKADKSSDKASAVAAAGLPQTSSTAFAGSTFGTLAKSSTSGFGALAGKPSVFGGGSSAAASPFGSLAGKPLAESSKAAGSGFGSTAGSGTGLGSPFGSALGGSGATSGFGGKPSSGFGSGFGGGFGGGFSSGFGGGQSKTLSSFGSANAEASTASKPAKAFGAPESDGEDDSAGENDEEGDTNTNEDESIPTDDKKKSKLSKVPVHDGEEDEVTLSQFRAKLFVVESKEQGWKERGVGNLKVNVHRSCVEFEEYTGAVIPGSFDVSLRETEDDTKPVIAARLIMRQENTHRVILNTAIIKALKFEEKPSNTPGKQYMFTAFDGPKPVNMLLKMNENNARNFLSEIAHIKSGLL